uniref:WPP domain-containing protein n=1 Tax=Oryza meridionalis TaxID=40149 RepID=A0A0E0C3I9_9ORYZ
MANDDGGAHDRWVRTVVDELRRFRALRPRPGRVPRFTPMPPEVRARMNKTLGALWPLAQSTRDEVVSVIAQRISGVRGLPRRRHGFTPEPEASRIAVAAEAEGFAAASAYAAGKSVATDEERSDLYQKYTKEVWGSVYRYEASRAQAAGTSRARAATGAALGVCSACGLQPLPGSRGPSASAPRAGSSRSRGVGPLGVAHVFIQPILLHRGHPIPLPLATHPHLDPDRAYLATIRARCLRRPAPSASGAAPLRCLLRGCWRVRRGRARAGCQGWVTSLEDGFVGTALVGAYAACGCVGDARIVFDGMAVRDIVSWGVMLDSLQRQRLQGDGGVFPATSIGSVFPATAVAASFQRRRRLPDDGSVFSA